MSYFKSWILIWILSFQLYQAFNVILRDPQGSFRSPFLTKPRTGIEYYPKHIVCTWKISADIQSVVRITFDHFDLENSTDCEKDFVEIKYSDENKPDRFCGELQVPFSVISYDHLAEVKFISDNSIVKSGFKATYKTVPYKKIIPQMLKSDASAHHIDAAGRIMRAHQLDAASPYVRIQFTGASRLYQDFVDTLNLGIPRFWFKLILASYKSGVEGRALYIQAKRNVEYVRLPFFINGFVLDSLDRSLTDQVKMMTIMKHWHQVETILLFASGTSQSDNAPLFDILKKMFMEFIPVLSDLQEVYQILPKLIKKKSLIPYTHLARLQLSSATLITRLTDNLDMTPQHQPKQLIQKLCLYRLFGTGCTIEKLEEVDTMKAALVKVIEIRSGSETANKVNSLLSRMDKVTQYKHDIIKIIEDFTQKS